MDKKHVCKYCGKEFETSVQLGGHVVGCRYNPNFDNNIQRKLASKRKNMNIQIYEIPCAICGNIFTLELSEKNYTLGKYKKTCCKKCAVALSVKHTNTVAKNTKIINSTRGRKMSDSEYIKRYGNKQNCVETIIENNKKYHKRKDPKSEIRHCLECNSVIDFSIRSIATKFCCDECKHIHWRRELSNKLKGKTGGYRVLSGNKKHKSGYYDNIYFDSSWELAYYVYCKEHNIDIKRCDIVRTYIYDGKELKYHPDFIVNNEIVEIKGFITNKTQCKINCNPDVKVLFEKDIQHCLNYCKTKYGNNFWETLYCN